MLLCDTTAEAPEIFRRHRSVRVSPFLCRSKSAALQSPSRIKIGELPPQLPLRAPSNRSSAIELSFLWLYRKQRFRSGFGFAHGYSGKLFSSRVNNCRSLGWMNSFSLPKERSSNTPISTSCFKYLDAACLSAIFASTRLLIRQ